MLFHYEVQPYGHKIVEVTSVRPMLETDYPESHNQYKRNRARAGWMTISGKVVGGMEITSLLCGVPQGRRDPVGDTFTADVSPEAFKRKKHISVSCG